MIDWQGSWIWSTGSAPARNAFVRFRRVFSLGACDIAPDSSATLRITADSRYVLYVNGTYLGQGPVRAWPGHWKYDTYDIGPYLRPGANTLAVLVQRLGEGNFQYPYEGDYPGLLARLDLPGRASAAADTSAAGASFATDTAWRASLDPAYTSAAPRISVQEGFEEQYDARQADGWQEPDYDDSAWPAAAVLRPADDGQHRDLRARDLPFLSLEAFLPQRVVSAETVRSLPHRFTIYARPYLVPGDRTSNVVYPNAYLATQVWAPADVQATLSVVHKDRPVFKLNGEAVKDGKLALHAGWNTLVGSLRRPHHQPEYVVAIAGPTDLRFSATGEQSSATWAIVGPFGLTAADEATRESHMDDSLLVAKPLAPGATAERGELFWADCDLSQARADGLVQVVQVEHLPAVDAFAQAFTDEPTGEYPLGRADGLVSGADWTTIQPAASGEDVRILVDFGEEVVGYHRFTIAAPAGTILDAHNFEFIQPDGRYNLADGMNNSFRYVCREGLQTYQTYVRRGFRFSYLILRHITGPVRLGRVEVLFASYPQSRRGAFASSDAKLDRIWQVGALTLRCCAEDMYTDCPTYEQTGWVGDARNEALVDWAINGDPRLWYRFLELTAQSLDRSVLTESHVPSAWLNILPTWSFLWMRSCREYMLYTGDEAQGRYLLGAVEKNIAGVVAHLNARGLFDIRGWNMFDWAAMDTPTRGVVTHQNCMAVHALRDVAELADWLKEPALAVRWRELARLLSDAINQYLWNEGKQAYTDCLREGEHSQVYSQQTQTVAYMSGVATGERGRQARAAMHNPPAGFVRAGSPFFEFFLLEAFQQEGRVQEFIDAIRRDWGFMIDMGATTFWEMWSGHEGRLTRSHCHGWSAAPTFFLSTYVLGVRPGGVAFRPVLVEPHPGDLEWCRGTVPTPAGDVEVQWENAADGPFVLRIKAPAGVEVRARLPRAGSAMLNGSPLVLEA